jgi:endonuclease YncB( thermonuclease family)
VVGARNGRWARIALVLAGLVAVASGLDAHAATASLPNGLDGVVVSVTDGDTIKVRLNGVTERVRLTGIDTPETHDPRTVVECFGREAAAQTSTLLPPGTAVRLEMDVERRDRYRRLLAYVWRADDGLFVNEELVADGWATPYRYPPNVKYADRFSRLGAEARRANAGLWGTCGGANAPTPPAPAPAPAPTPAPAPGGACDANYAGACVPVSSVDLDCADVGARNFQVVGTDVHRFDGDHDGIACE